jgi:hypothetical protein
MFAKQKKAKLADNNYCPASLDLGCGLGLGFLCVPGGIEELVMGVHSTGV